MTLAIFQRNLSYIPEDRHTSDSNIGHSCPTRPIVCKTEAPQMSYRLTGLLTGMFHAPDICSTRLTRNASRLRSACPSAPWRETDNASCGKPAPLLFLVANHVFKFWFVLELAARPRLRIQNPRRLRLTHPVPGVRFHSLGHRKLFRLSLCHCLLPVLLPACVSLP